MIRELKDLPPFIDFGFGVTALTAAAGETVTVWQNVIYNQDDYTFGIGTTDADIINAVSNFQYELEYNTPGTYEITASVTKKGKKTSINSNTITVTIE